MTKHRVISFDGIVLAVIAGFLLQAIVYNFFGINVAEVPLKVIVVLWSVFSSFAGVMTRIIGI